MEIRPLRPGEESEWIRLDADPGKFEDRLNSLLEYRQANPELHPFSYLVMTNEGKIVAKLRTNTENKTLYHISNVVVTPDLDFFDVGKKMIDYAKKQFRDRPIEAATWERPEYEPMHKLLLETGFRTYVEKIYFRRDIGGYQSPYTDPFSYHSMQDVGESQFLEQFVRIYPGNLNRNFRNDDPHSEFIELIESAGRTFDSKHWLIANIQDEPAGVVIAKIFDDMLDEGTIHKFGVFPEHRGKGLGKILHAKGMAIMAAANVKRYVGSTDVNNLPMISTFRSNGCNERGVLREYRLNEV